MTDEEYCISSKFCNELNEYFNHMPIQTPKQMLKHYPKRHIIVIMDKAPIHRGSITKSYIAGQKRLHVFYLPARSPELNADEKVWGHLKHEEMKSHQARNKYELKKITKSKLTQISKKPKLLRALFERSEIAVFF